VQKNGVSLSMVRIEGYRSCQKTVFHPHQHLSALLGPNGAGKTNILQAITLLGGSRTRRVYSRRDSATFKCRVLAEFKVGQNNVALRSTVTYGIDEENKEYVVDTRAQWRPGGIATPDKPSDKWTEMDQALLVYAVDGSSSISKQLRDQLSSSREYVIRPRNVDMYMAAHRLPEHTIRLTAQASIFLGRISYYSASQFTNPARSPSSIEINEEQNVLRGSARRMEHQRFLYDLFRLYDTQRDRYTAYISLVGARGLNLISKIFWKKVNVASSQVEVGSGGKVQKQNRQRILIVPTVQQGHDRLSFSQLSEGTFKTLALIFYLITDDSDLLLIEEPEVCVHHGLLASIIELIKNEAANKQIIFSTHSDFVLDHLQPENVFSVSREPKTGTSVRSLSRGYPARKIEELRKFLRTSGNLGEYWRQGGFEI
jgi:predicted ATP-dependent endonuclease of OLD family